MISFSDELYHYGVKGMKWGVRRTPEQLGRPKRTKAQVKRDKKRDRALAAKKKQEAKLAKQEKREVKQLEKFKRNRKKITKSPSLVMQNRDRFTDQELKDIISRFDMEKKLNDLSVAERQRGIKFVEDMVKLGDTTVKGYNLAANVYNTFKSEGKDLPIISTQQKKGDDKKSDDEEKK